MAYTCAIFDLDGTILNTLSDLADAVNHALETYDLPQQSEDHTRASVGNGIRKLIERSVPKGMPANVEEAVFEEFKSFYASHAQIRTAPYAGIPEALANLRTQGVRCAVVSNKADNVVQDLVETYFPHTFEAVVGEREGIARKPAPDSTFEVMREIKAEKDGCVYIGDSEVDVATAKNAGLPCICCTWGFRDRETLLEAGATILVNTPEELVTKILGQEKNVF